MLREEVDRELQVQDMVPTDAVSAVAGHGHLQLLNHVCSLFSFVSPYRACVCIHMCACVACVCVCVCVCVSPAQGKSRDKCDRRGNVKQSEEEAQGIHSLRVADCPVSAVTLSRMGMRKGWPELTQDLGSRSLQ